MTAINPKAQEFRRSQRLATLSSLSTRDRTHLAREPRSDPRLPGWFHRAGGLLVLGAYDPDRNRPVSDEGGQVALLEDPFGNRMVLQRGTFGKATAAELLMEVGRSADVLESGGADIVDRSFAGVTADLMHSHEAPVLERGGGDLAALLGGNYQTRLVGPRDQALAGAIVEANREPVFDELADEHAPAAHRRLLEWFEEVAEGPANLEERVIDAAQLSQLKGAQGLQVLGVMGDTSNWETWLGLRNPEVKDRIDKAKTILREQLQTAKDQFGDKLRVSVSASQSGVSRIVYEVCRELGIKLIGELGPSHPDEDLRAMRRMEYLLEGSPWNMPSYLVGTADRLLVLGSGLDTERRVEEAVALGKDITVFRGFNDIRMTPERLGPNGRFA